MIIGVTGSLATGKTTVSRMFRRLGAYVIDADKIVHRIIDRPTRKKLAGFIFDDKDSLKKLCRLIHPIVKKEIASQIKENRGRTIVIDAPLLIEAGLDKKCDYLVVVRANHKTQIERASRSLAISKPEAIKRIRMQMPLKKKLKEADYVIDNNGSLKSTQMQVKQIWQELGTHNG